MAKLSFKLGVSTKHRAISIQFQRPTEQLVMPVDIALELARRLILCAREIQTADEQKRSLEAMIKLVQ